MRKRRGIEARTDSHVVSDDHNLAKSVMFTNEAHRYDPVEFPSILLL